MAAVETLCSHCVLLESGTVTVADRTGIVLSEYRKRLASKTTEKNKVKDSSQVGLIRSITLIDESQLPTNYIPLGNTFHLRVMLGMTVSLETPTIGIGIDDMLGQRIVTIHTPAIDSPFVRFNRQHLVHCRIPEFPLAPGEYTIKIALSTHNHVIEEVDKVCHFHVVDSDSFGEGRGFHRGVIALRSEWWEERFIDREPPTYD
jgi:lipopolysaccharide transport system ATP-binding protein